MKSESSAVSRFVAYICPSARESSSSDVAPSAGKTAQPMLPSISIDAPSTRNGRRSAWRRRPTSAARGVVAAGLHRQDDELVAADAGDRVASRRIASNRRAKRPQDCVAGSVAADVVDVLEAVEVDHDEREGLARYGVSGGEPARSDRPGARGSGGRSVGRAAPRVALRSRQLSRTPTAAATNAKTTSVAMT